MRIVNLTGHPLRLTDGSSIVQLPSEGRARVISKATVKREIIIDGMDKPFNVTHLTEQEVVGLPAAFNDTVFVVSGLVAAHCPDRMDVVAPGRMLRDPGTGKLIGCQAFVKPIPTTEDDSGTTSD